MDGAYAESSVKREKNAKIAMYKVLIITLDAILLLGGLFLTNSILLFVGVAAIVLTVFFLSYFNVEYEVVYVNGEFEFSMIMNGSRRKTLLVMDMDNAEMLAPSKSHALDGFTHNNKLVEKNYSSGKADVPTYTLIGKDDSGQMTKAIFEPSEKMLSLIKTNPTYRRRFSEY